MSYIKILWMIFKVSKGVYIANNGVLQSFVEEGKDVGN